MATALDIITRALRLIGEVPEAEDPSAAAAQDGLDALNDMLDSMSAEALTIYAIRFETFTWPGATASRTIGSGGNFNTDWPQHIDPATFIRVDDQDYRLRVLTDSEWAGIVDKTVTSSLPDAIYGDRTYPLMNLYLLPIPSASLSLKLATWTPLSRFAALTTAVTLPPGYARMLRFNLAIELAAEWGRNTPAEVAKIASESRRNLKRVNNKRETLRMPIDLPGLRARSNIITGEG